MSVKGSISEKSFYSYFKNDPKKLPRIDMLNLFSKYCGYEHWNDFIKTFDKKRTIRFYNNAIFWKLIGGSFVLVMILIYFLSPKEHTFHFCFVDPDRNQSIVNNPIDIIILNTAQSSFNRRSDSLGCFSWSTKNEYIHFVVQSPYYKTDTIYRTYKDHSAEKVFLRTDDYALMLHYYANNKINDWKDRKVELQKLIADKAAIFQVLPHDLGIEIYSKNQFINFLTTPTNSLKNIEFIETIRNHKQIVKLKFRTKK